MKEKNYLGNGWANDKYDLVNISVNLAQLNELPEDNYGNVKLTVARMKQPNSKTKATHTVYENDYVPQNRAAGDAKPNNDDDWGF